MKNPVVSERYAEALFGLSKDKNIVSKVQEDLKLVTETLENFPDLKKMYLQPVVTVDDKKDTVKKIFGSNISDESLNFINLLFDKKREDFIFEIKKSFDRLVNNLYSKVIAQVYTAVDLKDDPSGLSELVSSLEKYLDKKVEVETYVDENIIGGVLVKIGDRVIDGTLKSRFETMARSLN